MGFYGDLEDLPLQDILYVLSSHGASGRLTLSTPADEITLVFERGRVSSVTTTDANLRIGRLLIDQGYVNEEDMDQALALQEVSPEYTRVGDVLVDLGFVNQHQIIRAVAAQFEASLFRILIQPGGTFAFTREEPVVDNVFVEEIPIEPIVLNAMRLADEWLSAQAEREAVSLVDAPVNPAILDNLEPGERDILLAILNGDTTKFAIANATGKTPADVDSILERLCDFGLIARANGDDPIAVFS